MESNKIEEALNELEIINLKLDLSNLQTEQYIKDFEKIKEIIGEDENPEDNEKESQSENKSKEDDIINDNMEVDNSELDQINEDKEFKKIYKSHSNFTEESINNTSSNEPKIEISETGDIKHIFDVEINLKKAIDNLNNQEAENNLKPKEE
jgi:hypothetical protein